MPTDVLLVLAGVLIGVVGTLAFITIWYIPPCGDDRYRETD